MPTTHEYHWTPTYFSPEHDFVGYDGERMIGRVTLEGRLETQGAWRWSNIGGGHNDVRQGYAASKELAESAVEICDQEMIEGRQDGWTAPVDAAQWLLLEEPMSDKIFDAILYRWPAWGSSDERHTKHPAPSDHVEMGPLRADCRPANSTCPSAIGCCTLNDSAERHQRRCQSNYSSGYLLPKRKRKSLFDPYGATVPVKDTVSVNAKIPSSSIPTTRTPLGQLTGSAT